MGKKQLARKLTNEGIKDLDTKSEDWAVNGVNPVDLKADAYVKDKDIDIEDEVIEPAEANNTNKGITD